MGQLSSFVSKGLLLLIICGELYIVAKLYVNLMKFNMEPQKKEPYPIGKTCSRMCVYIYIYIYLYPYIYIHTFEYVQTLVGSLQIHCGLPYLLPGPASCIPCCLYFAWRNLAIFVPRKCGFVGSRFYTLFSLQILSARINRPLSTIGKPKGYKLPLEMLFPLS